MRTVLACLLLLPAFASAEAMRLPPETVRLNQMTARFAPVDIRVDLSRACRKPSGARSRA